MWFDNWSDLVRVILVGVASYMVLILLIRASGKRTLAQLNAFDFVVTVALGSTLATILLSSDVSFVEGAAALALLLGLQAFVAFSTTRWRALRKITTAGPTFLLHHGRFDDQALKRHRVTRADVRQAIRQNGEGDIAAVAAVVLESNGRLSVIPASKLGDGSSLSDLPNEAN